MDFESNSLLHCPLIFFAKIEETVVLKKSFKPLKINHNLNKKHFDI